MEPLYPLVLSAHFSDEKTEVQAQGETCWRSQAKQVTCLASVTHTCVSRYARETQRAVTQPE